MKITPSTLFRPCLAAAVFLAGCLFDDDKKASPPWIGLPLDSIRNAMQLMPTGGSLLIANRLDSDPGIAVVDTATGRITAYYSELLPPSGMAETADGRIIIAETDYLQGAVSVFDPAAKTLQRSVLPFGDDNAVSAAAGKVFLIDRGTGVVTGFTGHTPGQNVVFDVQTGANSNPYDIAISNNLAFVARYNLASLLVLDATQLGGGTRDSIDLSQFSASDTAATVP